MAVASGSPPQVSEMTYMLNHVQSKKAVRGCGGVPMVMLPKRPYFVRMRGTSTGCTIDAVP